MEEKFVNVKMSWITDLADKAENILNKIDQNAATALLTPTMSQESSPHKVLTLTNVNNPLYPINQESTTIDINKTLIDENILNPKAISENFSNNSGFEMKHDTIVPTALPLNNNSKIDSREHADRLSVNNSIILKRDTDNDVLLRRLTEERDQALLVLQNIQTSNGNLAHSLSEQETNYAKLQQKYVVLTDKFEMQLKEANAHHEEFQKYRIRAQKALQAKDTIINTLKSNNSNGQDNSDSILKVNNDIHFSQNEFEMFKIQLKTEREENKTLLLQLEEVRNDLAASNKKHLEYSVQTSMEKEELQRELREYVEKILTTESEHRIMQQELVSLRQQLGKMSTALTSYENKERTIINKVTRDGDVRFHEYDVKIKGLTQALVQKQNEMENVTASRNALRIQLEKVEEELKRISFNKTVANVPRNTLFANNTTDDVKAQFPLLMTENPFDNRVARRMKKATRLIDTVGIRVGTFLRRYPLMRVGVLMYVALLHLWVMFVLFTSTPN